MLAGARLAHGDDVVVGRAGDEVVELGVDAPDGLAGVPGHHVGDTRRHDGGSHDGGAEADDLLAELLLGGRLDEFRLEGAKLVGRRRGKQFLNGHGIHSC